MSKNKKLAENNIDKALKRILSKDDGAKTYALLALTYAILNQDDGIRKLELVLSKLVDSINQSTNLR